MYFKLEGQMNGFCKDVTHSYSRIWADLLSNFSPIVCILNMDQLALRTLKAW